MAIPKEELKIGDVVWVDKSRIGEDIRLDFCMVQIEEFGTYTFPDGKTKRNYILDKWKNEHWCDRLHTEKSAKSLLIKYLNDEIFSYLPKELLPENLRNGVNFVSTKGETT